MLLPSLVIYNPKLASDTKRPHIELRARLYRAGKPIVVSESPRDPKPVSVIQQLNFGTQTPPGEYFLQITAADKGVGKKETTAVQWMDFELKPSS